MLKSSKKTHSFCETEHCFGLKETLDLFFMAQLPDDNGSNVKRGASTTTKKLQKQQDLSDEDEPLSPILSTTEPVWTEQDTKKMEEFKLGLEQLNILLIKQDKANLKLKCPEKGCNSYLEYSTSKKVRQSNPKWYPGSLTHGIFCDLNDVCDFKMKLDKEEGGGRVGLIPGSGGELYHCPNVEFHEEHNDDGGYDVCPECALKLYRERKIEEYKKSFNWKGVDNEKKEDIMAKDNIEETKDDQ